MKLRRSIALLIALAMTVGLVFTAPAFALEPVEGYECITVVEEDFDGGYDTTNFTVQNGEVTDYGLQFIYSSDSYMTVNQGIDTKNNKQYIAYFTLSTDIPYTDPWNAAWLGLRLTQNGTTPLSDSYGVWLGLTTDKLILTDSHKNDRFGEDTAKEGRDYALADLPDGLDLTQDTDFRIIYEGNDIQLDIGSEGSYSTLATVAIASDRYVTTKVGETSYVSLVPFADAAQPVHYFSLYNHKAATEEDDDDPLAPKKDWEQRNEEETELNGEDGKRPPRPDEGEYPIVLLDSFWLLKMTEELMTAAQVETLNGLYDRISAVITNYGTDEAEYVDASVDTESLSKKLAEIDEILGTEGIKASEVTTKIDALNKVFEKMVAKSAYEAFPNRFADIRKVLEDVLQQIEEGQSTYKKEDIEDAITAIDDAIAVRDNDPLEPSDLDNAYKSVMAKISALNLYSADGIPVYSESFTGSLTYGEYTANWTEQGNQPTLAPLTSADGLTINLFAALNDGQRYQAIHVPTYKDAHAFRATITKQGAGYTGIFLRLASTGENIHENDMFSGPRLVAAYGHPSIVIGTDAVDNFAKLYVAVEDGKYVMNNSPGYRAITELDLTTVPGALTNGNRTITLLAKDFGELIEIYVVTTENEKVKVATINVGKTSGVINNLLTGKSEEYSGVAVTPIESGHIGVGNRSGRTYVKDVSISSNIIPDEDIFVIDEESVLEKVGVKIDDTTMTVGNELPFDVIASYNNLKLLGYSARKSAEISVKNNAVITFKAAGSVAMFNSATGNIAGVAPGSDIMTVEYANPSDPTDPPLTMTDKVLITVKPETYVVPETPFDGRIVEAYIANNRAFRAVEEGSELIAQIAYELPNGDGGILPTNVKVDFNTNDPTVMAFDTTNGVYRATGIGTAKIWATVYFKDEAINTPAVNVEVGEPGTVDLGVSFTVAAQDIIDAAGTDISEDEMMEMIDAAKDAGMTLSVNDPASAALLFAELAEIKKDVTPDYMDIYTADKRAAANYGIYEILSNPEASADELTEYLFSKGGKYDLYGLDKAAYDDLSTTKRSKLMSRLFTQLAKEGASITANKIKDSYDLILESVRDSASGGGKDKVSSKTNDGLGGGTFMAATATATPKTKLAKPTAEQIAAAAARFSDMGDAEWARDYVGILASLGIVDGYEDGTIRPNGTITRDEFVKLLMVALKVDLSKAQASVYNDIPAGAWQAPYVMAATGEGLVTGIDAINFGAGTVISRQDMALMIYRAVLKYGVKLPSTKIVSFRDADMIAGYALEAVNSLAAAGVLTGLGDDTFAPASGATRAQAMVMIYQIVRLVNGWN